MNEAGEIDQIKSSVYFYGKKTKEAWFTEVVTDLLYIKTSRIVNLL